MGYSTIKIYNEGLKGWEGSGRATVQIDQLPAYTGKVISANDLNKQINEAEQNECRKDGKEMFVVLDLRTERTVLADRPVPLLATNCRTISGVMDELMAEDFRKHIPRNIPVYSITETGTRDVLISRYLKKYGYTNIYGLKYGMRGWIKNSYPVHLFNK